MSKAISLTGLSEFLKKCKEIFVKPKDVKKIVDEAIEESVDKPLELIVTLTVGMVENPEDPSDTALGITDYTIVETTGKTPKAGDTIKVKFVLNNPGQYEDMGYISIGGYDPFDFVNMVTNVFFTLTLYDPSLCQIGNLGPSYLSPIIVSSNIQGDNMSWYSIPVSTTWLELIDVAGYDKLAQFIVYNGDIKTWSFFWV